MRRAALLCCLLLSACAAPAPDPVSGDSRVERPRARFEGYPEQLFSAADLACDGPGQTSVREDRDSFRCESLPTPEAAGALILQFDGTIEDLPRYVISFEGEEGTEGYVVTAESYIRVPRREGPPELLYPRDRRGYAMLREILQSAGGTPL